MGLPKRNKRHQYDFVQSNGKIIKYTPWLVKHEQEFMYATEDIDRSEIMPHIEELMSKCVDKVDFGKMSDVDFMRLAIELRSRSKGSEHEIVFTCPNCGEVNDELIIDLSEDVRYEPFDKKSIEINEISFALREITKDEIKFLKNIKSDKEKQFMYVVYSIESINVNDQIYANVSSDEIKDYLGEELEHDEFKELVDELILRTGTIVINKVFNCKKCNKELNVYLDDIIDFFV